MHTRLEDLPAFELKQILTDSEPHLIGTFSHLRSVRAGRSWLYAGDHSLIGDLIDLNANDRSARFIAPYWSPASVIQLGSIVPWFDGYWQANQVTMILDPAAHWQRTEFLPSPAQHFKQGGVSGWMRLGQDLPEGAVATHSDSNGWDHEHCEICQRTIGVGGKRYAYINKTDRWLCERCYHDYAKPRSLGFLISA
jgi:hypothetical protein